MQRFFNWVVVLFVRHKFPWNFWRRFSGCSGLVGNGCCL